jgi:hypothetical protein
MTDAITHSNAIDTISQQVQCPELPPLHLLHYQALPDLNTFSQLMISVSIKLKAPFAQVDPMEVSHSGMVSPGPS